MALPELLPPAGTPAFLAVSHGIEPLLPGSSVPFAIGHTRARRLYTIAPRLVSVEWDLTAAQMAAVDVWYEQVLLAGDRHFSALVANQGPGLLYWDAQWEEPYRAEPDQANGWRVTGRLRLIGGGSATPPPATSLSFAPTVAAVGGAFLSVPKNLAISFSVALLPPAAVTTTSVGAAAGAGVAAGRSPGNVSRAGSAAGAGTATGVSVVPAVGSAAGVGAAAGRSDNFGRSVGTSTATAVGKWAARGIATGTGTATGLVVHGTAAGTSTAAAVGKSAMRGNAAGTSTAQAL